MTLPVLDSSAGGLETSNVNGQPLTINVPSNVVDGDLMWANVAENNNDFQTPPTGWTELVDVDPGNATMWAGYRIADTEPSSYDWTGAGAGRKAGLIARITGHNSSDPIDVRQESPEHSTDQSGTDTGVDFDSVTTTQNDCLILWAQSDQTSSGKTNSPSDGTEVADENNAATHACLFEYDQVTAGATPSMVNTISVAGDWTTTVVAIAPAAAAAGGFTPFPNQRRRFNNSMMVR